MTCEGDTGGADSSDVEGDARGCRIGGRGDRPGGATSTNARYVR